MMLFLNSVSVNGTGVLTAYISQHITVDTPSTAGILELDDSMVSSRQLLPRRKCAC